MQTSEDRWWRDAVIYQIYPKSFADSDGDGFGDIAGIRRHLAYVATLGVDAIWVCPWYPSPQADGGYDVADFRDIDPLFGDLHQAEALISEAHDLGIRVIADIVPNHTSDQHAFFQEALRTEPGSPAWGRYHCVRGSEGGAAPPSQWRSSFGGPAWDPIRDEEGRPTGWWYLHSFDSAQPDLNWEHPEVDAEFAEVLRFWFDRGLDGFRIDVAMGLIKTAGYDDPGGSGTTDDEPGAVGLSASVSPTIPAAPTVAGPAGPETPPSLAAPAAAPAGPTAPMAFADHTAPRPPWDQPGVHEVWRRWRRIANGYQPPRILVGEVWVDTQESLAAYLRPDELHAAFNFDHLRCPWHPTALRAVIERALRTNGRAGAPTTWVLENHDVLRARTRYGLEAAGAALPRSNTAPPPGTVPDDARGLARARAALLFMLGLPGSAYLYQGQELGLPEVLDMPAEARQDPAFHRTGGAQGFRDGCRVPMPWTADAPSFGFSPSGESWLPMPATWGELSVQAQLADPGSTLAMTRTALRLRRTERALGDGELAWLSEPQSTCLALRRPAQGSEQHVIVAMNMGEEPVAVRSHRLLVASGPGVVEVDEGFLLPRDTAAWLR